MGWHNDTCGCAEYGNYGQRYNPRAVHNQSCGCAECGNYASTADTSEPAAPGEAVVLAEPALALPRDDEQGLPVASRAGPASAVKKRKASAKPRVSSGPNTGVEMVAVPVELLDDVRALIAGHRDAGPGAAADPAGT